MSSNARYFLVTDSTGEHRYESRWSLTQALGHQEWDPSTSSTALAAARLIFIFWSLALPTDLLRTQNETAGFRANQSLENGIFGETIDLLSSGLDLTTPIRPRFQANSRIWMPSRVRLQLQVCDTTQLRDWMDHQERRQVIPINQSPFGGGFTDYCGRIFNDLQCVS